MAAVLLVILCSLVAAKIFIVWGIFYGAAAAITLAPLAGLKVEEALVSGAILGVFSLSLLFLNLQYYPRHAEKRTLKAIVLVVLQMALILLFRAAEVSPDSFEYVVVPTFYQVGITYYRRLYLKQTYY